MSRTQPILLIAAEPMAHTPALQRAFDLARAAGLPVRILVPGYDPLIERSATLVHPDVMRLARKEYLDERREWAETLVARWRADGLDAMADVVWAPVLHETIVARVLEMTPAIVIKDVGHEGRLRRGLYAAPDWKLLRYCPAPLMFVHARSARLPQRVLAAVDCSPASADGGPLNERIVRAAIEQAAYGHASLHLAHVFPYIPTAPPPYRTLEHVYEEVRRMDRQAFDDFADQHGVAAPARHWLPGDPADLLAELIDANRVDLAVLGSVYRSALDRLFIGGTAEAMLQAIPCDVLVVKPEGFLTGLAAHLDLRAIQERQKSIDAFDRAPPQAAAA
jgi:universal stress protein E